MKNLEGKKTEKYSKNKIENEKKSEYIEQRNNMVLEVYTEILENFPDLKYLGKYIKIFTLSTTMILISQDFNDGLSYEEVLAKQLRAVIFFGQ